MSNEKSRSNFKTELLLSLLLTLVIVIVGVFACKSIPEEVGPALDKSTPQPQLLTTLINSSAQERDITINKEGSEIYYTMGDYTQKIRCIVGIIKDEDRWMTPEILNFSGSYNDIEPALSPDGQYLYFASTRPLPNDSTRTDYNIWRSKRSYEGWLEPEVLDTSINSSGDEYFPSIASSGNLYFTASRENGMGLEDIFMSKWNGSKFESAIPLDSTINSEGYEFNAYIHPDEDLIIFSSYERSDGFGGGDLYYSTKNDSSQWMPAINMGPAINTKAMEYCPFIDLERGVFYFTSNRVEDLDRKFKNIVEFKKYKNQLANGLDNIYKISLNSCPFSQ